MSYPNDPSSNPTSSTPISETAQKAWDSTRQGASDALESGTRYLHEQPVPSVLGALGLGLLLGVIIGWALGHSGEEDYEDVARRLAKDLRHKLNLD